MAAPIKILLNRVSPMLIFLFLLCIDITNAIDPVSVGGAVAAVAGAGGIYKYGQWMSCSWYGECCDSDYIKPDFEGLSAALESKVYGQHLVKQATMRALKGHFGRHQPSKALAMSFHGITGSGKNHVSNLIVKHIYKKGMESQFVHFFSATHHFPHAEHMNKYKELIRGKIMAGAKSCGQSMFIFDEMDKMPPTLINIIGPYLDYHLSLDGVDYRRTTFIFLSNAAGAEISKMALEHWQQGKEREDIQLSDLQSLITIGAYNDRGGWWHNALMETHLISVFIPFLPLERRHIKKCIVEALHYRSHHCDNKFENCDKYKPVEELVNRIADSISFFPKKSPQFATSGCKRITDEVSQALMDED